MASNPPGECCTRGFKHAETYITGDPASEKVLFFLTDVLGQKYINSRLLADEFAKAGYLVVVPDLFYKDPVTENFDGTKFPEWLQKHTVDGVQTIVDKTVAYILKEYKPKYFVATGYCWGGKYVTRLLGKDAEKLYGAQLDAGAIFHPSFVTIEEVKEIVKPLFIGAAETDTIFTNELRKQTEETLADNKAKYLITLTSGVAHGFSVRGDLNDPYQLWAKEKVFRDGLEYLEYNYELKKQDKSSNL